MRLDIVLVCCVLVVLVRGVGCVLGCVVVVGGACGVLMLSYDVLTKS